MSQFVKIPWPFQKYPDNSQKSRLISSQYTQINSIHLHESSISINWFKILLMDWKNLASGDQIQHENLLFPLWSMLISVCNLRFFHGTPIPPNPKLNESPRVASWVWILFLKKYISHFGDSDKLTECSVSYKLKWYTHHKERWIFTCSLI